MEVPPGGKTGHLKAGNQIYVIKETAYDQT